MIFGGTVVEQTQLNEKSCEFWVLEDDNCFLAFFISRMAVFNGSICVFWGEVCFPRDLEEGLDFWD